jgi:hypothetical protein
MGTGSQGSAPRRSAGIWRYAATAVLGFTRRPAPAAPARAPWRDRSSSSYEAPLAADDPLQLGRPAQLPPFGRGNGIDALFWTPLARLRADRVDAVLAALQEEDIAGWVAPAPPARRTDAMAPHDLWVGSLRLEAAQDLLMRVLRA